VLVALDVLDTEILSQNELAELRNILVRHEGYAGLRKVSDSTDQAIEIAGDIVRSLRVTKRGVATLTIGANVSDIDAMTDLNIYFRARFPHLGRDAIYAGDIPWFASLKCVQTRDLRRIRKVRVQAKVPGSGDKTRSEQELLLRKMRLRICDPAEVALVAAAYACKFQGAGLLPGILVRTSVQGFAVANGEGDGVSIVSYGEARDPQVYMAGG
jgi:hypothetical protein